MKYCKCGVDLEYAPADVTVCYGCRNASRMFVGEEPARVDAKPKASVDNEPEIVEEVTVRVTAKWSTPDQNTCSLRRTVDAPLLPLARVPEVGDKLSHGNGSTYTVLYVDSDRLAFEEGGFIKPGNASNWRHADGTPVAPWARVAKVGDQIWSKGGIGPFTIIAADLFDKVARELLMKHYRHEDGALIIWPEDAAP